MKTSGRSQLRQEVMAEIIETYREARGRGVDGWQAVEAAYPGIPTDVTAEAMLAVEDEATEAWWRTVERTIDGEVIRNALANAGSAVETEAEPLKPISGPRS